MGILNILGIILHGLLVRHIILILNKCQYNVTWMIYFTIIYNYVDCMY